jgi:hypothetical protein
MRDSTLLHIKEQSFSLRHSTSFTGDENDLFFAFLPPYFYLNITFF